MHRVAEYPIAWVFSNCPVLEFRLLRPVVTVRVIPFRLRDIRVRPSERSFEPLASFDGLLYLSSPVRCFLSGRHLYNVHVGYARA